MKYLIKCKFKGFYTRSVRRPGRFCLDYADAYLFNSAAQARLNKGMLVDKGEIEENLEIIKLDDSDNLVDS